MSDDSLSSRRLAPCPRAVALATAAFWMPAVTFAQQASSLGQASAQVEPTLPAVTVRAASGDDPREAARRVQVGPLGERDSIETPYSISVVTAEQMSDRQAKNLADALRHLPWVQPDTARPQTRGVQGSVIENSRVDGFNVVSTTDYPMEQFERVEVLNGVAGSLYGPATGSGIFSFRQKRAGRIGLNTVTLGVNDSGAPSLHADLWTPLDGEKRWRVRANLLQDSGDSYVSGSRLRRSFGGISVDADLTSSTRFEFNASRYQFVERGLSGSFGVAAGVPFPSPVDPKRQGYGQRYAGDNNQTDMVTVRVVHQFASGWTLEGGLLRQIADREARTISNTLTNLQGNYASTSSSTTASRFTVTGNQLSLSGRTVAGGMTHDIVIANNGFDWNNYNPVDGRSITLGQGSLSAPVAYPEPAWPNASQRYITAARQQQSLILADTIGLTERWQLMGSVSYSWMKLRSYNRAGATTRESSDSGFSPFVSVLYRLDPASSVYLSRGDTLQPGDIAPTGTANENTVLDPYRSRQWELGYKTRLGSFDINAAAFHIERPYAYIDAQAPVDGKPTYRTSGKQVNHGLELSAIGNVSPDLSVYAGVAWLDPRIKRSANAASEDKRIVGLSRWSLGLGADLRIAAVPGLSTNARIVAIDKRAADYANSDWISGYVIGDLGLRYQQRLLGKDAIWRLTVDNVTDKRYWTNVVAGGLNGYSGTGNATAAVGAPRTVRLSLQVVL